MSEHRKLSRQRTYKSALLLRNDENISLRCILKNSSDYGALIVLQSAVPVPREFEILIESDQLIASCKVAWRDGKYIGARAFSGWKHYGSQQKFSGKKVTYERYVV